MDDFEDESFISSIPEEILEKCLSYCDFNTISNCRLVCRQFNEFCQHLLNHGFSCVDKFHASIQRNIKAKLPRRESERRCHPLAKHVNALSAIETRLSLLNMTYMKYIDLQLCCFIPGKVLDELFNVLRALADVNTTPRTHELLQELRDISSMAMEHFDEKVVPSLRGKISPLDSAMRCLSVPSLSTPFTPHMSPENDLSFQITPFTTPTTSLERVRPPAWKHEATSLKASVRATSTSLLGLKKDVNQVRSTESELTKKLADLEKRLHEQGKVISEQNRKITEQSRLESELNSKIAKQEENIRELKACNTEYRGKLTEIFSEIAVLRSKAGLEPLGKTGVKVPCDCTGEVTVKVETKTIETDSSWSNMPGRKRQRGGSCEQNVDLKQTETVIKKKKT